MNLNERSHKKVKKQNKTKTDRQESAAAATVLNLFRTKNEGRCAEKKVAVDLVRGWARGIYDQASKAK